jgi:hypothetical protein
MDLVSHGRQHKGKKLAQKPRSFKAGGFTAGWQQTQVILNNASSLGTAV